MTLRTVAALVLLTALAAGPLASGASRADTPRGPCAGGGAVCLWDRVLGGDGEEKAYGIAPAPDGGWFVAGNTREAIRADHDALVLRLGGDGTPVWRRRIGGAETDQVFAVAPLGAGAVLAGHTRSEGSGESDLWVVRVDGAGDVLWRRSFGGPANDRARTVAVTAGGGIVVAGFTASAGAGDRDAWVLGLDGAGEIEWQRTFGGPGDDGAFHLAAMPGGGTAVTGYARAGSGYDLWVARLGADGGTVWERRVDNAPFDAGTGVAPAADGGLTVVGATSIGRSLRDNAWVMRLDGDGATLWSRVIGGARRDAAWAVVAGPGDGAIVAGATASRGAGSDDAWIFGLTAAGETAWERVAGGAKWDRPTALALGPGGVPVIAGTTTSAGPLYENFWVFALDPEG